eukprot:scaffold9471_cov81-Skeletonema_dohrnii-CCMP3373.AAC.2
MTKGHASYLLRLFVIFLSPLINLLHLDWSAKDLKLKFPLNAHITHLCVSPLCSSLRSSLCSTSSSKKQSPPPAADFEDDFEEKSPSAKSFSLRGAVAAASAEDAADEDEDEELKQWQWGGGSWKQPKVKIPKNNWKPPKVKIPQYTIPDSCRATPACKWRSNECVHRNFEDEELFDSQNLEKFDDYSEEDEVNSEYDEVDED